MKKIFFLFLSLFLFTFLNVNAQNTWFFGDHAALNFSPSPSLYTGLQPQTIGSGSVSIGYDYLGNALFYTDGKSIWDKNHTLISNALNHSSSGLLDNVLVLPQPGVSNTYFIFHGEDDQLYMSKVIATSTSVTVSFINDLLYTSIDDPTDSYEHSGVGIGCITGGCKNNIGWVVIAPFDDTHNKFVAFKIDASTSNASSIINTVSIINPRRQFASPLKLSPNLQKIAYCAYGSAASTIAQAILASNLIGVYDFDAISGVVSLSSPNSGVRPFINVPLPFPNLTSWFGYYGLEFSPNNSNIFISTFQGYPNGLKSQIYELDISNPNWMLPAWIYYIGEVNFSAPGIGQGHTKLALASNGKIYINKPGDNDLAVVNNPNALSMSTGFLNSAPGTLFNSTHAALNTWNLPNIARGNCVLPPCNITLTTTLTPDTCTAKKGTATVFPSGGTAAYTYLWNTVPAQSTATAIGLTGGNFYTVTVTSGTCTQTRTVTIPLVISNIILTGTPICVPILSTVNNGNIILTISGGTAPYTFLWSNAATTQNLLNVPSGSYTVNVTDANGCTATGTYILDCLPACTCQTANCRVNAYYVKSPSIINNYINCNDQIKVDCNKSLSFGAEIICPTDCIGTLNEILKDASGNVLATQTNVSTTNTLDYTFTISGTYTLVGSYIVNGIVCKTCEAKFIVNQCPPALCIPCSTAITNISTIIIKPSIIIGAIQVDESFNFTELSSNVTEVRAVVSSFSISGIDANGKETLECLPCITDPKAWGSIINGSLISGIIPTINIAGIEVSAPVTLKNYNNPRQITWASIGNIFSISNPILVSFLVPPASEYSCCTRKAKICVKFIFRDNDCKECEVIGCFNFIVKKK